MPSFKESSIKSLVDEATSVVAITALRTIISIARPMDGGADPIEIKVALRLLRQMQATRQALQEDEDAVKAEHQ